jgi:hypothetical protein
VYYPERKPTPPGRSWKETWLCVGDIDVCYDNLKFLNPAGVYVKKSIYEAVCHAHVERVTPGYIAKSPLPLAAKALCDISWSDAFKMDVANCFIY